MTNVASIVEGRLGTPRADLLRSAARAASGLGLSLHLVGGSVRDALLGGAPTDLDVSYTAETSEQPRRRGGSETRPLLAAPDLGVAAALAQTLGGVADPPTPFGTAKLRIGGVSLDLVMARRESYAAPGALPKVEPGSLADDLARRDFSINAMAVSLSAESWGDLVDPFDGAGDLERRLVRMLHPGSFRDDATRLFRAARYAGRLGFDLDPETERLAREGAAYVDTISGDRIRHELERIFEEPRASDILRIADGLGLLQAIHPALRPASHPDAIEGERGPAMLAGLALGLSPHDAEEVAERLNLGSEWSRVVRDTAAVRKLLPELASDIAPSRVYRLLHGRHEAALSAWEAGGDHPHPNPLPSRERGQERGNDDRAAANVRLYLSRLRHVSTSLSGGDIVAMGVPEGPRVGEVLRELLDARLDGVVTSDAEERELAANLAHGG